MKRVLCNLKALAIAVMFVMAFSGCLESNAVTVPCDCGVCSDIEKEGTALANDYNYTPPNNVCWHFSERLTKRLTEKGYMAFTGLVNTIETDLRDAQNPFYDTGHAVVFVLVPIEATSGKIISLEDWERRNIRLSNAAFWDGFDTNQWLQKKEARSFDGD